MVTSCARVMASNYEAYVIYGTLPLLNSDARARAVPQTVSLLDDSVLAIINTCINNAISNIYNVMCINHNTIIIMNPNPNIIINVNFNMYIVNKTIMVIIMIIIQYILNLV